MKGVVVTWRECLTPEVLMAGVLLMPLILSFSFVPSTPPFFFPSPPRRPHYLRVIWVRGHQRVESLGVSTYSHVHARLLYMHNVHGIGHTHKCSKSIDFEY